jgi:hypothetical protein
MLRLQQLEDQSLPEVSLGPAVSGALNRHFKFADAERG